MKKTGIGMNDEYHRRVCECDKFGCVPCMQRYLRNHYRQENKKGKKGRRWTVVGADEFTDSNGKNGGAKKKPLVVLSNPSGTYRRYL